MIVVLAKKNNSFNYKSRFQETDGGSQEANIKSKWENLKRSRPRKKSFLTSPLFLVLFLITSLIVIYVLNQYE